MNSSPSKFVSFLFVSLLVLIHTTDMVLTQHYIGDDWQRETFLPMKMSIKWFGIYNAVWISRICIYSLIFTYFMNWKKWRWHYFLICSTTLYWASMVTWLWSLGYLGWTD